jgi:hypothetical protein
MFPATKISYLLLILFLLSKQVRSQQTITILQGIKTAETGEIKKWKPNLNDPVLKIKTRDERGLIHAQDLEKLIFKRYTTGKRGFDEPSEVKNYQLPIEKQSNRITSKKVVERNTGIVIRTGEGQEYSNINPADPSIAVGPSHVIQMINGANGSARFTVLDKSGNTLIPSTYMDQLPGTSYNGGGDCITFYDQLTDRFVMTEFGDSSRTGIQMNSLIMAVSATQDPTGSWYVYEFHTDFFPDYPKFGNWHDAWFGVTRDFTNKYEGNSIWAFDKQAMIAGQNTVKVQRARFSDGDNKYNSLVPVTLGGTSVAGANSPGLFLYYNDDELTANPNDKDSLTLIGFKVDFNNPTASSISTEGNFTVAAFSSDYCINRNCAPSPGPQGYDVVGNRIMHKPMYRNFGTHQSIVANHTVDANGNALSGIRWYEIRKTNSWMIYQQNTYAPQEILNCTASNERHRYMGSIMMNGVGQILLAYNYSSRSEFASLAFTGRGKDGALHMMNQEEEIIAKGKNYGTDANRWGDYNDIAPDPLNDSVFWFTGMVGNGTNTWSTNISILQIRKNPDRDARIIGIINPNPCISACDQSSRPQIRIRNNGNEDLTSVVVNIRINGTEKPPYLWNGILNPGDEKIITLPEIDFQSGLNNIDFVLSNPNGSSDQRPENDTARGSFVIDPPFSLPFSESAAQSGIPPTGWSVATNGSSALTWQNTSKAFFEGGRSFLFDNYNNNERGKYGELISPQVNTGSIDSLSLDFMIAAGVYDLNSIDTFMISISEDCGTSYKTVYKKWGEALATRPGLTNNEFIPLLSEWRKETVDLSLYRDKKIRIAFRVINNHGNNIYLDRIEVKGYVFPERDLDALSVSSPFVFGCNNLVSPGLIFKNTGKDSITKAEFSLWVNGELKTKKEWTGKLARNKTAEVIFPSATVSSGKSNLMIIVSSVNNNIDQNILNDSARSTYQLLTPLALPLKEGFTDVASQIQWPTSGTQAEFNWTKVNVGSIDAGSIVAVNYNKVPYKAAVYTPLLSTTGADSIFAFFDIAASYTDVNSDTLSVAVSTDCGQSWVQLYKKWGNELSTRNPINTSPFIPQSQNDWRNEKIDLTPYSFKKENFMLRFQNNGNGANNLYIDNIRITGLSLPDKLKQKGYQLLPNPADRSFDIKFYPFAIGLKSIRLINIEGKVVYQLNPPPGSNWQSWKIETGQLPEGIYLVVLNLNDSVITEKIFISHH